MRLWAWDHEGEFCVPSEDSQLIEALTMSELEAEREELKRQQERVNLQQGKKRAEQERIAANLQRTLKSLQRKLQRIRTEECPSHGCRWRYDKNGPTRVQCEYL